MALSLDTLRSKNSANLLITYSVPIFLALITLMGFLLFHFHWRHMQALESYQKIKSSHEVAIQLMDLSEEKYHLQLEILEYALFPGKKRLKDISVHKEAFEKKLADLLKLKSQSLITKEIAEPLGFVQSKLPQMEKHWNQVIALAGTSRPKAKLMKAVEECESFFDSLDYNERLDRVISKHQKQVAAYEAEMGEILQNRNGLIGLSVALLLGLLMTLIHQRALRAKQLELALLHANKMACIGEMSVGLAKELQIPLMKIQGFNGRLKAHFKKDRVDEVSSVWTYTQEIDDSLTQMRSQLHRLM